MALSYLKLERIQIITTNTCKQVFSSQYCRLLCIINQPREWQIFSYHNIVPAQYFLRITLLQKCLILIGWWLNFLLAITTNYNGNNLWRKNYYLTQKTDLKLTALFCTTSEMKYMQPLPSVPAVAKCNTVRKQLTVMIASRGA